MVRNTERGQDGKYCLLARCREARSDCRALLTSFYSSFSILNREYSNRRDSDKSERRRDRPGPADQPDAKSNGNQIKDGVQRYGYEQPGCRHERAKNRSANERIHRGQPGNGHRNRKCRGKHGILGSIDDKRSETAQGYCVGCVWIDEKRSHYDLIAALVYFVRAVNKYDNPYPANQIPAGHFVLRPDKWEDNKNNTEKVLTNIFSLKGE